MLNTCEFVIGRDYPIPIVDHEAEARIAKKKIFDVKKDKMFKYESRIIFENHGSRKVKSKNTTKSRLKSKVNLQNKQLKLF